MRWGADRYGLSLEHIKVDPSFDAGVGYVQRIDFARTSLTARFSPRPARSRVIRKYVYLASLEYTTDAALTTLQNRQPKASMAIDFQNSDVLTFNVERDDERLPRDFAIAPGILVPKGPYTSDIFRVSHVSGYQRRVSGKVAAGAGSFYGGTLREAGYTGRVVVRERLAVEPGISLNWVDLPFGDFTVRQLTTRVILTPSPRMLISGLAQFNAATHAINSSLRLHWEYQPGSDLFLVIHRRRDTTTPGFPDLSNHSVALKVTRLVRF